MRLYFYGLILVLRKLIFRENTGKLICWFAKRMGVVYIKMAQILAMQNYGEIFTEEDRIQLSQICDNCQPIPYDKIIQQIQSEYNFKISDKFKTIDQEPLGAASISQVHRAVLLDGAVVALKIRRLDITRRVQRDVKQLQRLICRFGKITKFRNFLGSEQALNCWAQWIYQETDFQLEQHNIERYAEFLASVNGKIENTAKLCTPKLFPDLCTENIIAMELIAQPTLNRIPLNDVNKRKIAQAVNDYISLSFYALLHKMPVVFHGDPHTGNLYFDKDGNLGFLDMGLIFEISDEEADFIKSMFLCAYSGNAKKLSQMLISYSDSTEFDRSAFEEDITQEVGRIHTIPVTQFFIEMMNIFTGYNISPPVVYFKLAKSFLALAGINTFTGNLTDTQELLTEQITEYYLCRTLDDFSSLINGGISLLPDIITSTLTGDLSTTIKSQIPQVMQLGQNFFTTVHNCEEIFDYFKSNISTKV